ncbi:MAG: phage holin family protein [Actinomycetota bacterium]|nr:phage holin family protein [Actinomycetota bacterium]
MIRDSKDEQSVGELLGELYRGASSLIQLELELAKTEMSQKASRVGKNVGFLAAGGAIAYAGFLAILAGIIALLGLLIPLWLSALIIGLVVAGIGGALVMSGLKTLQQESVAPQKTLDTLKEDKEWMTDQTR